MDKLGKLRKLKEKFNAKNILIDFNVHSEKDLPQIRGGCFWHNNRGIYIQKELILYGLTFIGETHFGENHFSKDELKKECVQVINSLTYQARKLLINRKLSDKEKVNLMKWCIYASIYALVAKDIFIESKREALSKFNKYYSLKVNPIIFLKAKIKNNVSNELAQKAYKFLSDLDIIIFEDYKNGRK